MRPDGTRSGGETSGWSADGARACCSDEADDEGGRVVGDGDCDAVCGRGRQPLRLRRRLGGLSAVDVGREVVNKAALVASVFNNEEWWSGTGDKLGGGRGRRWSVRSALAARQWGIHSQ